MSTESVMPSKHLILCRPLLLLPPVFPSIRVFSKEHLFRETYVHLCWAMELCHGSEPSWARGHRGGRRAPHLACRMNWVAFSAYFCARALKFTGCSTMWRFSYRGRATSE